MMASSLACSHGFGRMIIESSSGDPTTRLGPYGGGLISACSRRRHSRHRQSATARMRIKRVRLNVVLGGGGGCVGQVLTRPDTSFAALLGRDESRHALRVARAIAARANAVDDLSTRRSLPTAMVFQGRAMPGCPRHGARNASGGMCLCYGVAAGKSLVRALLVKRSCACDLASSTADMLLLQVGQKATQWLQRCRSFECQRRRAGAARLQVGMRSTSRSASAPVCTCARGRRLELLELA